MNILVVNDDSINSVGLKLLVQAASQFGTVYVSAPLYEQSAKSAGITIKGPVTIKKGYNIPFSKEAIAVDGTPADSLRAGLKLFNVEFGLVLSGINEGINIASDIQYSGTVAGAFEASLFKIPAIAFSAHDIELEYIFDETVKLLDEIINHELYLDTDILNVNYPDKSFSKPLGVKLTSQGKRLQLMEYKESTKPDLYNLIYTTLNYKEEENSDINAFNDGYISVTPLKFDRTDYDKLKRILK